MTSRQALRIAIAAYRRGAADQRRAGTADPSRPKMSDRGHAVYGRAYRRGFDDAAIGLAAARLPLDLANAAIAIATAPPSVELALN